MNYEVINFYQTAFVNFPSMPSDGDTYLNQWISYTYSADLNTWVSDKINENFNFSVENNVWELKTPESQMDTIMYFTLDGENTENTKAALTNAEYNLDRAKNDLSHRIYVMKTIALQHGTEEEFAEYFSQLDAMLDAEDVFNVTFPPAPFQE